MVNDTVSVVIPTYNRAHLILETIDSIFAQNGRYEVIVVDDGSTDQTLSVLAKVGSHVRTITIPNSGDLVARNVGLREAKGTFIAFCDSDDVWEKDFLKIMLDQWSARPDLVSCYANFRIMRGGEVSRKTKLDDAPASFYQRYKATNRYGGFFEEPIADLLIGFQPLFTSCMMVRRKEFLALGGWDEGVSRIVGCDFATALRLASAPPIGLVTEPLVRIRKHGESVSSDIEKMNFGDAQVLEYVLATRPELAELRHKIVQSISKRRGEGMDSAFARKDYKKYLQYYSCLLPEHRTLKRWVKKHLSNINSALGRL